MIAFYDAKYTYNFWRPVTAIRAEGAAAAAAFAVDAATAEDPVESGAYALAGLTADVNWTPLATTALDPSYPGAHAVVSAAGADVLASFFHNDRDSFAVSSEVLPGVERSFTSFSAAADEASVSRISAGQHFRFDQVAGQRLGRRVADYVPCRTSSPPTRPATAEPPSTAPLRPERGRTVRRRREQQLERQRTRSARRGATGYVGGRLLRDSRTSATGPLLDAAPGGPVGTDRTEPRRSRRRA